VKAICHICYNWFAHPLRLCHTLRKPALLRYDEYIRQCSELLARVEFAESDCLLRFYIQLQRIGEEVSHAFNYESMPFAAQEDAMRIDMLVRAFEQQMAELRMSISTEIWNNS
jgi:hypothetical protein